MSDEAYGRPGKLARTAALVRYSFIHKFERETGLCETKVHGGPRGKEFDYPVTFEYRQRILGLWVSRSFGIDRVTNGLYTRAHLDKAIVKFLAMKETGQGGD